MTAQPKKSNRFLAHLAVVAMVACALLKEIEAAVEDDPTDCCPIDRKRGEKAQP